MIQNIMLPQMGVAQNKKAIQGDHCVLETPHREITVFEPMIKNIILPRIGLPRNRLQTKTAIQEDHCVLKTPCRGTVVV